MPRPGILLLCVPGFLLITAVHSLRELGTGTYSSTLQPGKTSLLYFSKTDSSENIPFLTELEEAVTALQDYGVSVAKVNCMNEDALSYCTKGNAYLFRGTKLLREFPADTLFDVNAIVANVLFVLLYNEIKYITSASEFRSIESVMKGKKNVVFVYVRAIGIPEHRAVMEAAFVYGALYQFVLTTETALLDSVSPAKSDLVPAKLVYCHCKLVTSRTQECRRTLADEPLSTLSIHRFLKLVSAPLVIEASGDPEKFTSVQLQLGLPMVFILSQQDQYDDDRATAEHVAWQLLGKAGVATLTREMSDTHIPQNTNVALKRPEESEPVRYMLLGSIQEIVDLVENAQNLSEEDSEDQHVHGDPEAQDDEVAEAVYRDRRRVLPLHLVPPLTEETFRPAVTGNPHSVVLFYASWEAVSVTFLHSFLEMASKYKDALGVYLGRVNCADMNDICNEQNITSIPAVTIYQAGKDPLPYTGVMGCEELARYIPLSALDCPLYLHTREDAEGFLSGTVRRKELPHREVSALGVVAPDMKEAADALVDAGKALRGFISLGIYSGDEASALCDAYGVPSPAILFTRTGHEKVTGFPLRDLTAADITGLVRRVSRGEFPEITLDSFPSFLTPRKPLLVLFSDGDLNGADEKHVSSLVRGKYLEPYAAGWINLRNTPAGYGILKRYFGSMPSLPLLALIHFDAKGHVFALPSDQPLSEVTILYWLEMIKGGAERPVYTLSKKEWGAPLPDYDFLARMDAATPSLAAQKIPIQMRSRKSKEIEVPADGGQAWLRMSNVHETGPDVPGEEKPPRDRSEL